MRYVKDSSEAKDIVQDGFIKIYSKIKQFKGKDVWHILRK